MSVCCGPGVALGVSALWLCSGVRLVLSFFRPPLTGHVSVVHALPCACSSYLPSLHIVHISSHVQRSRARRSAEQGSRVLRPTARREQKGPARSLPSARCLA